MISWNKKTKNYTASRGDIPLVAWAAGFWEGEGTIVVYRHTANGSLQGTCRCSQVEKTPIALLHKTFGGSIYKKCCGGLNPGGFIWEWTLSGFQAKAFLELIQPYVCSKGRRKKIVVFIALFSTRDLEARDELWPLWLQAKNRRTNNAQQQA